MSDTDFDYTLDERQRSMLDAMGIKMWLPERGADPAPQTPIEVPQKAVLAQHLEQKQPAAGMKTAGSAPKTIVFAEQIIDAASPAISLGSRPAGIEQMDWPALQSAVSGCQACGLCASRKTTVFGIGQPPTDAAQAPQVDWLIVGEAPGENEDIQGEPFVGQAGKLLDNMLAAMQVGVNGAGLTRSQGAYIANVLKCRPPANRNPSPEEVAMCEPYLARQIELLRPKMILAMGKYAISALTGSNDPVGKLRGRVHTLKHTSYQAPVIVTYHPAYLLRNLPDKAKAWADLLLAMQTYRDQAKK
jgi:uracil-DNA glycosylase